MSDWWYVSGDRRVGPSRAQDIEALITSGEIESSTLVWRSGMDGWHPVSDVEDFRSLLSSVPPPLPGSEPPELPVATGKEGVERPGRWRRFFARTFDIQWELIAAIVLFFAFGYLLSSAGAVASEDASSILILIAFVIAYPLVFLIDAACASLFGNTPGKALLSIQAVNAQGDALGFSPYFSRNMRLWVQGLGLGIPLVSLITMLVQSSKVYKTNTASYDAKSGHQVQGIHRTPVTRRLFVVLFVPLYLFGYLLLGIPGALMDGDESNQRPAVTPTSSAPAQRARQWSNPTTSVVAAIDTDWTVREEGTAIDSYTSFTDASGNRYVAFGTEIVDDISLDEYVDLYLEFTKSNFEFDPGSFLRSTSPIPTWHAQGTLIANPANKATLELRHIDNAFWRLITVREPSVSASDYKLEALSNALWGSVPQVPPRMKPSNPKDPFAKD